jgi:hypothetical protein
MNPKERMKEMGFDAKQIEFLVTMSQDCARPSDFDREVQKYLDALNEEEK